MSKFLIGLKKVFKWVSFILLFVFGTVGVWVGIAWVFGYLVDHSFDLACFGPQSYVGFGSFLLVLIILVNLVTIGAVGWGLFSYGRSRGLIKKLGKRE
jgi:hypothetical protein